MSSHSLKKMENLNLNNQIACEQCGQAFPTSRGLRIHQSRLKGQCTIVRQTWNLYCKAILFVLFSSFFRKKLSFKTKQRFYKQKMVFNKFENTPVLRDNFICKLNLCFFSSFLLFFSSFLLSFLLPQCSGSSIMLFFWLNIILKPHNL